MNRTSIEWCRNPDGSAGWSWNPLTGCLNHNDGFCKGGGFKCYAYKLAHGRLKERYLANKNWDTKTPKDYEGYPNLDPFYPRFWPERLDDIAIGSGKGIFVCDMGELFGDWIPESWRDEILQAIIDNPEHRFYLLTKQPQNLIKFSPFPPNCYVGATCTSKRMINHTLPYLMKIGARLIYLSLEPLLEWDDHSAEITGDRLLDAGVGWLIIGAQTKPYKPPAKVWVDEIIEACKKAGVPYFLKDNLKPILGNNLRQEFPK